jgi:hypothetical protein
LTCAAHRGSTPLAAHVKSRKAQANSIFAQDKLQFAQVKRPFSASQNHLSASQFHECPRYNDGTGLIL